MQAQENELHETELDTVAITEPELISVTAADMLPLVTARYNSWSTVRLNGKLKMDGLPIKPSIRISMKHRESVIISIRAPFIGEVGRIQIDNDSALLINKTKNVFCKLPVTGLIPGVDASVGDIQDILLARAFILGVGTMSAYMKNGITAFLQYENCILIPEEQPSGYEYAFNVGADGKLSEAVFATSDYSTIVHADYNYDKQDTIVKMSVAANGKEVLAELSYDMPEWGAEELSPIELSSKYTEVDIRQFLRF